MRLLRHTVLAAASLLTATPAAAQFAAQNPVPGEDFHVELGLMWWSPTPRLTVSTGALTALGTPGIDFVQDFGIGKTRFTEFRGVLKGGRSKVRFSRLPVEYLASARLQRTVVFGGRTYNVGVNATADLDWEMWRIGYERDFVSRERGLLGLITELKYNTVKATITASDIAGTVTSSTDVTAPVPALGFVGRVYPHRSVAITMEYTGLKFLGFIVDRIVDEPFEADFNDFEIYGTVSVTRFFGLQGGYRSVSADYAIDDDSGDLGLKGPYFGAMVRF
jgi:hypothetical protein